MMARRASGGTARILVVDDVAHVRALARAGLERRDFEVDEAEDGETALRLVRSGTVDLVVLDVHLPRMSGLAVLSRIRHDSALPVILVTGLDDETDRVIGLDLGADDYIVKPFSPLELAARVASLLRRSALGDTARMTDRVIPTEVAANEPVVVNHPERRVVVSGLSVDLTPKEFDLLAYLVASPGRVFTRAELLDGVWGSGPDWQDPATVTEHVRRLRRKIETDPESPQFLQTVRGVGYRFDPAG